MHSPITPRPDLATRRARRLAKRFGLPPKMAAILREQEKARERGWLLTIAALSHLADCSVRHTRRALKDPRVRGALVFPRRLCRPAPPPPSRKVRLSGFRVSGRGGPTGEFHRKWRRLEGAPGAKPLGPRQRRQRLLDAATGDL